VEENKGKFRFNAVCVDFDGVIAGFADNIEEFGTVIPGAREALQQLRDTGYKIIIHTARPSDEAHREQLAQYLQQHGIPFDEINQNSDCTWPATKPPADLYIDDRALRFEGDWQETIVEAMQILRPSHASQTTMGFQIAES
jgi:hypothetical protein